MIIEVLNICPRCGHPGMGEIDTDKFTEKNEMRSKCSGCFAFIASYKTKTQESQS